ncbi:MAG: AbrB/MazE/SpoVT family DNA-binding domain-containing protein [Candidatus Nanohalobium sp.]
MAVASVDDQGRVYIPKSLREQYGDDFRIIDTKDGLVFMPLPENPVEKFQEKEKLEDKSVEELKKDVREDAEKQVLEE